MRGLRQFTSLTTIIIFVSCSTRNENVNGHWHSVTPEIGSFKTLDIDDSVTTTDRYEIEALRMVLLRKDVRTGKPILPFQHQHWTENFQLDGDTLTITDINFGSYKYLKSKIENCEMADRYNNSVLNISLSECPTAEDYDHLEYCANLFIGRSIKHSFEDLTKDNPDSIFVQVRDVLITLNDIPSYIDRMKDASTPNEPFELVLHADNLVDEAVIKNVLEKVPSTIPTYRAVIKDGRLGVSKIVRE